MKKPRWRRIRLRLGVDRHHFATDTNRSAIERGQGHLSIALPRLHFNSLACNRSIARTALEHPLARDELPARAPRSARSRLDDQHRPGHEAVADVVHRDAESFERTHAEQVHVARLGEHHVVGRLVSFGPKNRIPHLPLDDLARRRRKGMLAPRRDAGLQEQFRWKPTQFRAGINQRLDGRRRALLVLRVRRDEVDFEHAHGENSSSKNPLWFHRN